MDPIITLAAAFFIGGLFLRAGWHKLANPYYYGGILGNYVLLPTVYGRPLAFLLGALEIGVGLAMLMPITRMYGGKVATAMLLIYLLAMAANLLRGRKAMDCGCSGPLHRQALSVSHLVRNLLLACLAWIGASTPAGRSLIGMDWILVIAAPTAGMLFYLIVDQLLVNRHLLSGLRR